MTALLSWIVLSHRYRYAGDNTGIAFLAGIVGGFGLACVLIRLVFKYGVEEEEPGHLARGLRVGRARRHRHGRGYGLASQFIEEMGRTAPGPMLGDDLLAELIES